MVRSLVRAVLTGEPLQVGYFRSRSAEQEVRRLVAVERPDPRDTCQLIARPGRTGGICRCRRRSTARTRSAVHASTGPSDRCRDGSPVRRGRSVDRYGSERPRGSTTSRSVHIRADRELLGFPGRMVEVVAKASTPRTSSSTTRRRTGDTSFVRPTSGYRLGLPPRRGDRILPLVPTQARRQRAARRQASGTLGAAPRGRSASRSQRLGGRHPLRVCPWPHHGRSAGDRSGPAEQDPRGDVDGRAVHHDRAGEPRDRRTAR